jgi:hypothetical protein
MHQVFAMELLREELLENSFESLLKLLQTKFRFLPFKIILFSLIKGFWEAILNTS